MQRCIYTVLLVLCSNILVLADDWPEWRGPNGNGVSAELKLPVTWGEHQNISWKAQLEGNGLSSPVVFGNQLIVTSQVGRGIVRDGRHPTLGSGNSSSEERSLNNDENKNIGFVVESFSRSNGQLMWQHEFSAQPVSGKLPSVHRKTNLANPSPVTDGQYIYALFGTGQLTALNMSGNVLWEKHLGVDYGPFQIVWGHSSSPTIYKDLLILLCDHEPASYLLALNKQTGKEMWRADRGSGLRSYSTPTVISMPDSDELVVNSSKSIEGYDPSTGKRLWYFNEPTRFPVTVPSFADGVIYTSRGYRSGPYMAIKPGGRGDLAGTEHILWHVPTGAPYVSSVVHYKGVIYLASDAGVLQAADAKTGERLFQMRTGGVFSAAPIAGDGKIYFVSENGETIVLRASREPEIVTRNSINGRFLASPIAAYGQLFLRSDDTIYAIGNPSME